MNPRPARKEGFLPNGWKGWVFVVAIGLVVPVAVFFAATAEPKVFPVPREPGEFEKFLVRGGKLTEGGVIVMAAAFVSILLFKFKGLRGGEGREIAAG